MMKQNPLSATARHRIGTVAIALLLASPIGTQLTAGNTTESTVVDLQALWIVTPAESDTPILHPMELSELPPLQPLASSLSLLPGVSMMERGSSAAEPLIRGFAAERNATSFYGIRLPSASPTRTHAPINALSGLASGTVQVSSVQPSITLGPPATGGWIEVGAPTRTGDDVSSTRLITQLQPDRDGWSAALHHSHAPNNLGPFAHVQLSHNRQGDLSAPDGRDIPSQAHDDAISVLAGYRTHSHWVHQMALHHQQQGRNANVSLPLDTVDGRFTALAVVHQREPSTQHDWDLRLRYGFSDQEVTLDNRYRMPVPMRVSNEAQVRAFHLDLQWLAMQTPDFRLFTGFDLNRETRLAIRQRGSIGRDFIWPDIASWQGGVFSELQLDLRSAWQLRWGLRFDHHDMTARRSDELAFAHPIESLYAHFAVHDTASIPVRNRDSLWSTNLLLRRELSSGQTLYAGVASTAQVPGTTERYRAFLQALGGGFEIGSPQLTPERKWEWVGGWSMRKPNLQLRIEGFVADVVDYHWRQVVGSTTGLLPLPRPQPVFSYRNVDVRQVGAEISGRLQTRDARWQLPFRIEWVHAELQSGGSGYRRGDRLPELPASRAHVSLQRQQALSAELTLRWELAWQWIGSRSNALPGLVPTYFDSDSAQLFNLGIELGSSSRWSLHCSLSNLFDTTYLPYLQPPASGSPAEGSEFREGERIPFPGRSLLLWLELQF